MKQILSVEKEFQQYATLGVFEVEYYSDSQNILSMWCDADYIYIFDCFTKKKNNLLVHQSTTKCRRRGVSSAKFVNKNNIVVGFPATGNRNYDTYVLHFRNNGVNWNLCKEICLNHIIPQSKFEHFCAPLDLVEMEQTYGNKKYHGESLICVIERDYADGKYMVIIYDVMKHVSVATRIFKSDLDYFKIFSEGKIIYSIIEKKIRVVLIWDFKNNKTINTGIKARRSEKRIVNFVPLFDEKLLLGFRYMKFERSSEYFVYEIYNTKTGEIVKKIDINSHIRNVISPNVFGNLYKFHRRYFFTVVKKKGEKAMSYCFFDSYTDLCSDRFSLKDNIVDFKVLNHHRVVYTTKKDSKEKMVFFEHTKLNLRSTYFLKKNWSKAFPNIIIRTKTY